MIEHVWTVLCLHAVIDRDSNSVSLLDVVEELNIGHTPARESNLVFSLDLMTLWVRADRDVPVQGRGRVTFLSPSGEITDGPFEFDIDLSQHRRNRSKGRFRALHINEPGQHRFLVELQGEDETEWNQVATVPIEVNFVPQEETE